MTIQVKLIYNQIKKKKQKKQISFESARIFVTLKIPATKVFYVGCDRQGP